MKIREKITLTNLAILFLFLVIASIVSYLIVKNIVINKELELLESISISRMNCLESVNEQNLERLKLVSSRTQLRLSLKEYNQNPDKQYQIKMSKILKDAQLSIHDFKEISVINLDGVIVASTNVKSIGTEHINKRYFLIGRKENSTELFFLDKDKNLTLNLAGPLMLNNKLLGVVLITVSGGEITKFVTDYSLLGETGYSLAVFKTIHKNKFIISPRRINGKTTKYNYVNYEDLGEISKKVLEKQKGSWEFTCIYSGKLMSTVTNYSHKLDVGFSTRKNSGEIHRAIKQYRKLLLTLSLISLIMMFMLVYFSVKSLTKPILKLAKFAEKISKGDLDQKIDIKTKDEIGLLGESFNLMGVNLKKDITRRKSVEEALRKSNEDFQLVTSNIITAVWKADIGENGTFENTYTSPVYSELLGLPPGALKNDWDKYFSYVKPEYIDRVKNSFNDAIISPGKIVNCEFEVIKENGQEAWFQSRGRCFEKNGKLNVFGSTMDITDRKLVEEELLKLKENLESQVAEKTKELNEKISDLQRFVDATIERELRMKELYDENEQLKKKEKI